MLSDVYAVSLPNPQTPTTNCVRSGRKGKLTKLKRSKQHQQTMDKSMFGVERFSVERSRLLFCFLVRSIHFAFINMCKCVYAS